MNKLRAQVSLTEVLTLPPDCFYTLDEPCNRGQMPLDYKDITS